MKRPIFEAPHDMSYPVKYAEDAGFSSCDVLPIENDFWRFYLLRP